MVFDPEDVQRRRSSKTSNSDRRTTVKSERHILVSQRNIDMLESAIGQLIEREPEWTETARVFAEKARLHRVLRLIAHKREEFKKRQGGLL